MRPPLHPALVPFERFNKALGRCPASFRCEVDAHCESTAGDWALLALEAEDAVEDANGGYAPPASSKRRSVLHGTPHSTSTGSNRVEFEHDDPLKQIPASQYLPALTGEVVSSTGRTRCPSPHHPDEHPSAKCYGTRWVCFSCGAGGSIIDAASAIYAIEPTGSGYREIRRRLLADLGVGGPV
jgi:hypothetical protein